MESQLSQRKKKILSIIVDAYADSAEPVGSRTIAKKYHLELSPATIRNEMSDLEEAGLITHPHTSAGRVPTDLGYRYYIDWLVEKRQVSPAVACEVTQQFRREIEWIDELVERASRILATLTGETGIVSYPEIRDLSFRRLDLYRMDRAHVWVAWISATGQIQHHVIEMGEEVSEENLKRVSTFFNEELTGVPFRKLAAEIARRLENKRDSLHRLYELSLEIVQEALRKAEATRLVLDGSLHMLEKPEFQELSKIRSLFQALEKKHELFELIWEDSPQESVQVRVGRENKWREIWDCSLITAGYQWQGKTVGFVSILGPRRMHYASLISFVEYLAHEMSRAFDQWR
jgi:heat-inducible transcriptional repressor